MRSSIDENITQIELSGIKRRVLAQLNGKIAVPLVGLKQAYTTVYDLIEQTIVAPLQASEEIQESFHGGNSMLILGPRSSGKSLLISTAIADLKQKYKGQFIAVSLSGIAQTDDKLALQELAAQIEAQTLSLENEENEASLGSHERVHKRLSSRSTLERLMSMFSGRTDVRDDDVMDESDQAQEVAISIVIILDEFERFATMQNRQTLLYNLLDVAQSSLKASHSAPSICVLGVSSRMAAPEMLEKRVRSRFSHRVIVTPHARDLSSFWDVCSAALKVPLDSALKRDKIASDLTVDGISRWNSAIDYLYSDSLDIKRLVSRSFDVSRDPKTVQVQFLSAVREAVVSFPFIDAARVVGRDVTAIENAGYAERVAGLPLLSLMILVCAARAEAKSSQTITTAVWTAESNPPRFEEDDIPSSPVAPVTPRRLTKKSSTITKQTPVSFMMAYEEYEVQTKQAQDDAASSGSVVKKQFRTWSRDQAMAAWEGLERCGLIVSVNENAGTSSTSKMQMQVIEIGLQELRHIIKNMTGVPEVVSRWCKAL